jgi:predicted  nucleic acid-binding Zn-ribbon protein
MSTNMQHPAAHLPGAPGSAAGSNLEDVLRKLRTLQEVLFQRFRTEHEISEIPRALSTKTEVLNRLKRSYVEKSELYDQLRVRIHDLRERAIEAEREREQYEGQMDAIRTQREYEALDKEIRDSGEREVEVRRELQREEEHLDEMAATQEQEEALIKQQDQEVADEQQRIESETAGREAALQELIGEESKITPGLDTELLFKFERIIRNKEGLGIVALRAGVCTGCQMILPPFFANRVRTGEEIMFCPNCSRIVFYGGDEDFEGDAFDASSAEFDDEDLMFDDDPVDSEETDEAEEGEDAAMLERRRDASTDD